jgi:hypothetical protein
MRTALKKADNFIQQVGDRWQSYGAFFGIPSAIAIGMTAFLLKFRPFFPAGWSWPEATVLGLAGACALVAVVSVGMIAWRLFRPLAAPQKPDADAPETVMDKGARAEIKQMRSDLTAANEVAQMVRRRSEAHREILIWAARLLSLIEGRARFEAAISAFGVDDYWQVALKGLLDPNPHAYQFSLNMPGQANPDARLQDALIQIGYIPKELFPDLKLDFETFKRYSDDPNQAAPGEAALPDASRVFEYRKRYAKALTVQTSLNAVREAFRNEIGPLASRMKSAYVMRGGTANNPERD